MSPTIPILCQVQALYSFKSNDSSSLSFNKGDIITVLNKLASGWWDGFCNGARGWFPSNYVKILTDDVIIEDSSKNTTRREYRLSLTFNNTLISDQRQNDDWIAQRTEDGSNIYYFNPCTDETRFEQQEGNISNLMTKRLPSLISLVVPEKNPSSIYQQSEYGSTIWSNQSNITLNSMNDDFEQQQTCITTEMPKLSSRRLSLIRHTYFHKQPLTWPTISSCIATALQQLVTAAKNNQYHLYAPNAAEIVNIIRFMLISSSTLDKNSPNVKSNAILRTQHHSLIASMAKLVLSTQIPQRFTDKEHQTLINKILVESSELLLAVRNFISTCQTKKIQLVSNDLQWIPPSNVQEEHHLPSTLSIHNQRYSLQPNLAENIDTLGTCIQDSAEIIIKFISSIRQETLLHDITSIATRLFTHFQNLSNQTSLFLGYLDETDFSQVEEQYKEDMVELQQGKHKLIDSLGLLLFHLQTLTNTHATNGISDRLKEAKQATGYLFKPIDSICQTVIRLANKSRGTTVSRTSLSTTDSIKKINNDQEQHMSHLSTLLSETLERHHSESILPSSKLKQQPTLSGSSSIMQSSQQTAPSKQILYSRRLKKFFGDDTSTVKVTPKGETDPNINSTTTTTTTIISTVTDMTNDGRPSYLDYDYQPNDIIFNKEGQVKGGTLPALVERLTSHDYLDMKFINTFLLTYRSFCSSIELLNLLKNRYNLVCSPDLTPEESLIWEEKKLKLVRLRVFNVLKNWLELYYYDEDNADQLLDHLLEFTQNHIRTTLKFSNGQLESLIEQRRSEPSGRLKKMILTLPDPPEPILPKPRRRLTLLDIDTLEMARQLTIMDFKLYSAIRPIECLNKAWSREDDTTTVAVNIRASIKYCNQVTSWVSDVILSQQDIKKRSMIIKYWVQVAEKCRILNNFNTCMAILSAFDNSSVGRLRRTWEVVGTRTTATLQQIRKLMGAIRNFVEYRAIIHSINPPCIPFLGIYLQDLTFIEDGNPDELKAKGQPVSLINFAKRAKTAEVIREIQQYQSSLYQLKSVEEIQKFIKSNLISTRDEEQLYKESLKLEPREREDEKITRLLQESGFL